MKIVVTVKQVPATGADKRYTDDLRLDRASVEAIINPLDEYAIEQALRKIPEVRVLHSVSGPFDLIAIVAATSIGELDALIDRIGALDGVERTTSAIVLSTRIER